MAATTGGLGRPLSALSTRPRGGTAVCLQTHRRCPTAGARRGGAAPLGPLEVEQHGKLDRGSRPAVGCKRREQGRRPWSPLSHRPSVSDGLTRPPHMGGLGEARGSFLALRRSRARPGREAAQRTQGTGAHRPEPAASHGLRVACHCVTASHVRTPERRRGRETAVLPRFHTAPKQRLKSRPWERELCASVLSVPVYR